MAETSVIVPVYNGEEFLRRCLDSLIKQNVADYEIVAVNDGSTDSSLAILAQYQQKYPHILKIVEQENLGVSKARAKALMQSSGKYITYIDCDDKLGKNYLKYMLDTMKQYKAEIGISRSVVHYPNKGIPIYLSKPYMPSHFLVEKYPSFLPKLDVQVRGKCFDRSYAALLENDNFVNEDLAVVPYLLAKAPKVAVANFALYHHFPHTGSLSRRYLAGFNEDVIPCIKKPLQELQQHFIDGQIYEKYKEEIDALILKFLLPKFVSAYKSNMDEKSKQTFMMNIMESIQELNVTITENKYYKNYFVNFELDDFLRFLQARYILNQKETQKILKKRSTL